MLTIVKTDQHGMIESGPYSVIREWAYNYSETAEDELVSLYLVIDAIPRWLETIKNGRRILCSNIDTPKQMAAKV